MDQRDRSALLGSLVERLVIQGAQGPAAERQRRSALQLCVKYIGSNLTVPSLSDEGAQIEAVRRELTSRGSQDVIRFSELHHLLTSSLQSPGTRCALLHLLLRTSKDKLSGGHTGVRLSMAAALGGLPQLDGSVGSLHSGDTRQHDSMGREARMAMGEGSIDRRLAVPPKAEAMAELHAENTSFEVPEASLVRGVLFAAQGIDSQHVRYNINADAFMVDPSVGVPRTQRTLVHRLCELGFLYRKLQAHASTAVSATGGVVGGAVQQSFCGAMQAELVEYFRVIANLEARAHHPIPAAPGLEGPSGGAPYLTLRRLHLALAEPLQKLRVLASLGDRVCKLKGGALASAIHSHAQHGDPSVRALVNRILSAVSVPIFSMLQQWMLEGRLEDKAGEFFIARHSAKAGDPADLWRQGYSLQESMLPPMISSELAAAILRCGKSIIFLRECCGDTRWAPSASSSSTTRLEYGQDKALEHVVRQACEDVNSRLVSVMFDQFGLPMHCDAIKRYMLTAQGDFISCLMDTLTPELDKPADIFRRSDHMLSGHLETAIRASNAQYDDPQILDCMRISSDRTVGEGERGWDVFCLSYNVREPLSTVFTAAAMTSYKRVFKLLWDIKHVEHVLSKAWHLVKPNNDLFRKAQLQAAGHTAALWQDLRRRMSLRNEMSHFTTNLQYYFVFEVLEGNWRVFDEGLKGAKDLDAVILAHETYLQTVVNKSLLDEESQHLHAILYRIFDVMHKFFILIETLHRAVADAQGMARLHDDQLDGRWNSEAGSRRLGGLLSDAELHGFIQNLDGIHTDYNNHLNSFVALLPAQAHVDLRFLKFRLDFTDYYARGFYDGESDDSAPHTPT